VHNNSQFSFISNNLGYEIYLQVKINKLSGNLEYFSYEMIAQKKL
jgi:hypothetical protein